MKAKTHLSISLISTVIFFFISASCSSTDKTNNKVSKTKNNATLQKTELKNKNKPLPKNWPWKGVCMPSAHSDFHDVEYLHSIGVNFIRIQPKSPLRAKRENSNPTKAFYDELNWIDKVLDECKKYDMTSIIAFNYLVLDPKKEVDDKSEEFWNNRTYQDSTINMVDIIVKRYQERGDELSAYEVIGEPAITSSFDKAKTPPNLEGFYKRVLSTIRKYDNQRYFLLNPGPWGSPENYKGFNGFNINDDKLIYGAHMYVPHPFTHQGIRKLPKGITYPGTISMRPCNKETLINNFKFLKDFEVRTGNLIYVGEFQAVRWAQGGNQWVIDVADILDNAGWSWTYFAYNPDHDFWNPFFEVANPNDLPEKWTLKNTGREADIWKYMINNYFSKNKTK